MEHFEYLHFSTLNAQRITEHEMLGTAARETFSVGIHFTSFLLYLEFAAVRILIHAEL